METKWKPAGPQANLPNGNPSDPALLVGCGMEY